MDLFLSEKLNAEEKSKNNKFNMLKYLSEDLPEAKEKRIIVCGEG